MHRGALLCLLAFSISCGGSSVPTPPLVPTTSPTPSGIALPPTTGACGGLELNPINRHYFRDKATGRPVLIVGYRNLTPEFAPFVPTAPPGQPQPPGGGTLTPDPRFTDHVLDDVAGRPGQFNFPNFQRHYVSVFHLGTGNDPALDPMYDDGNGLPTGPAFLPWPWLRRPGAAAACYGVFGDPNGIRYDVGGDGACPAAWNEPYFARLGDAVTAAGRSCITAEVKVFDKSIFLSHWRSSPWASDNTSTATGLPSCSEENSWRGSFYLQRENPILQLSQRCYVDKIVDVTQAGNVVYEIENENDTRGTEPWARTWAQRIKGRTSHLVSYSSLVEGNLADTVVDPSIDIVNLHFGEGLEQDRGRPRDFITENWNLGASSIDGVVASGKPVNVDEFGKCYGTGATYDSLRKMAWTIVASGGHFHIEDACDPRITPPGYVPPAVDAKPREVVENIRRLVEDSGLRDGGWNFSMSKPFPPPPLPGEPVPAQVPGRFCMGPDAAIFATTKVTGPRDYLCYYDGSDGFVSKTIEGIEPAAYSALWWDPRSGGFAPGLELNCATNGTVTFSAPDAGDWVLMLRKTKDC